MFYNAWGLQQNNFMFGYNNPFMFGMNPYMMRFNMMQAFLGSIMKNFTNNSHCHCNHNRQPVCYTEPQISVFNNNIQPKVNTDMYNNYFIQREQEFSNELANIFTNTYNASLNTSNTSYSAYSNYSNSTTQNKFLLNNTYNRYTTTDSLINKSSSVTTTSATTKSNAAANHVQINTAYKGSASDLNKKLKGVLAGKGDVFLRAQQEFGINAAFLASVCIHESGNGSSRLAKQQNNVGGIRVAGKTTFRTFNSVDECIMYMASLLKKNYIDKGLTTIGKVGAKYCPTNDPTDKSGTNNMWASRVNNIYRNCVA